MKQVLLVSLVFVITLHGVNAWCLSNEKSCEPYSTWNNTRRCLECSCDSSGEVVSCCSMNASPVIRDRSKCERVKRNCKWTVRGKEPKWNDFVTNT